jgi:23S rRNA (adenine2503-C2)-methyltransferase
MFEGGAEGSFMDKGDATKYVICISSQVGCPMRCTFCHLTNKGMYKNVRNLTGHEIAGQVTSTLAYKRGRGELPNNKECLVSFMAMGEPLLNLNNVLLSIDLLNRFRSPTFKFDISTTFPKGKTLENIPPNLGIRIFYSLHSPFDRIRKKLMPNTESIQYAFNQLDKYYKRTGIRPIIHYTFIDGVNDSPAEVQALISLIGSYKDFHLRVLRYNPYDRDTQQESRRLLEIIEELENHMYVKLHKSPGYDIAAACGQFICEV